jgi:F-type H+-transporting ATPase subunit b
MVRSAFDLPAEQHDDSKSAQRNLLGGYTRPLRNRAGPGQRHRTQRNGQKVAWTIADYLASLEQSVSELLQGRRASPKLNQTVQTQTRAGTIEPSEAAMNSAAEPLQRVFERTFADGQGAGRLHSRN